MKRVIVANDTIEAMSKLTYKYADKKLFDENFCEFIYFSPVLDSHGPRVKFYGGSTETNTTRTAPSLGFGADGVTSVVLQKWMNKQNCPNAYDKNFLDTLIKAVNNICPILLLVWFLKLDESEALHYFEGSLSWSDLMNSIKVEDKISKEIKICRKMDDLDRLCKKYDLYKF